MKRETKTTKFQPDEDERKLADAIIGVVTDADLNEWEYGKVIEMIKGAFLAQRLKGFEYPRSHA